MTKAKFLVVYCLFISGLCCMANVTKDINMRFKDVRQGLSHQTVNCFYQDEFGFLWIGTQDGLNRFDGRKFEVFKPDNANPYSININNIRQVCGNKAGLLFIRSLQSVTLYDMRLNRFRVLREGEVAGICYAHDALWIATGKEIYRYRNLDQAPELFFSFPSDEEDVLMNSLMVRQNQTVVVGTSSKGIYCMDQSAHITRRMDVGAVNSITEDRNGSIWIATRNRGLIRLDEDGTLTHFKHNKVAENTINHNNVHLQGCQTGGKGHCGSAFGADRPRDGLPLHGPGAGARHPLRQLPHPVRRRVCRQRQGHQPGRSLPPDGAERQSCIPTVRFRAFSCFCINSKSYFFIRRFYYESSYPFSPRIHHQLPRQR